MTDSFHVEGAGVVFLSRIFSVERRKVSSATESFERDVAVHPGAVAVLAINTRGEIGVIHQYRAAFDRVLLEIPAGTQDVAGESARDAAQRELEEELGCRAAHWRLLGLFMNSPGWTNQVMTIFEARDLTEVDRRPVGPEERRAHVSWLSPLALRSKLRSEAAIDSTTAVALHRVFGTFFNDD